MLEWVVICLFSPSVLTINAFVIRGPYDYCDLSIIERSYNNIDQNIAPAQRVESITTRKPDYGNGETLNGDNNTLAEPDPEEEALSEVPDIPEEVEKIGTSAHHKVLVQLKSTFNEINQLYFLQKNKYKEDITKARIERDKLKNEIQRINQIVDQYKLCEATRINEFNQTLIKFISRRAAFLAQRNSGYTKKGLVPFSLLHQSHVGLQFNLSSGHFKAAYSGTYHFYFQAMKMKNQVAGTSKFTVQIKKKTLSMKSVVMAEGHINTDEQYYGWFSMQVQATTELKQGETVYVQLLEGSLHEIGPDHFLTEFGGFLVSPT